jgi:hypothetical protein
MKARILGFSIGLSLFIGSTAFAGDAVAIGYNAQGVWTAVTYYSSSRAKGGRDYKTAKEAQEAALRDVRKRSEHKVATTAILASSNLTGFVAVARGENEHGTMTLVRRGRSQFEADARALAELKKDGASANQKIVYRYFSYGADSEAKP